MIIIDIIQQNAYIKNGASARGTGAPLWGEGGFYLRRSMERVMKSLR